LTKFAALEKNLAGTVQRFEQLLTRLDGLTLKVCTVQKFDST